MSSWSELRGLNLVESNNLEQDWLLSPERQGQSEQKVLYPSSIGRYPVHLHRLPSKACSICFCVGLGLFLSSVYIDMTNPGVQKPHCEP